MAANRFRPNIVLQGGGAFAEDMWEEISLVSGDGGDAETGIQLVSKCTRCLVSRAYHQTRLRRLTSRTDHLPVAKCASRDRYKGQGCSVQSFDEISSQYRSTDEDEGLYGSEWRPDRLGNDQSG